MVRIRPCLAETFIFVGYRQQYLLTKLMSCASISDATRPRLSHTVTVEFPLRRGTETEQELAS